MGRMTSHIWNGKKKCLKPPTSYAWLCMVLYSLIGRWNCTPKHGVTPCNTLVSSSKGGESGVYIIKLSKKHASQWVVQTWGTNSPSICYRFRPLMVPYFRGISSLLGASSQRVRSRPIEVLMKPTCPTGPLNPISDGAGMFDQKIR